jgi:hypothetical protein
VAGDDVDAAVAAVVVFEMVLLVVAVAVGDEVVVVDMFVVVAEVSVPVPVIESAKFSESMPIVVFDDHGPVLAGWNS